MRGARPLAPLQVPWASRNYDLEFAARQQVTIGNANLGASSREVRVRVLSSLSSTAKAAASAGCSLTSRVARRIGLQEVGRLHLMFVTGLGTQQAAGAEWGADCCRRVTASGRAVRLTRGHWTISLAFKSLSESAHAPLRWRSRCTSVQLCYSSDSSACPPGDPALQRLRDVRHHGDGSPLRALFHLRMRNLDLTPDDLGAFDGN